MKKQFIFSLLILLIALAVLHDTETTAETYTTSFPLSENPISEGNKWINGKAVGLESVVNSGHQIDHAARRCS